MGNNRAGKQNVKSVKCDEKKDKLLSVFLAITILFLSSIIMVNTGSNDASASEPDQQPKIEYIAINTIIDNNYAITNILEKFKNPCSYSIDETFQVQIPAKAFISNFSLCINNETHYSQIVSKDEGREKFEEAVIKGSNAGLVEAKDKNIFSYSVSISPKSEIIVGLRYEQFLEKSLGGYEYLIPLSGAAFGSNMDKFSVDITLRSKLLVTACKIEDYFADANLTFVSSHEAKVAYETSLPIPKNDFRMNYGLATPPSNGTMLNYNDGAQEYFFHIFSPQRTDLGGEVMAKEIIFVLDKSGSMSGNKISQLKSAFDEIINQLHSKDSFNIIMFDSVIEKYKSDLIRASERNKLDAVDYINEVEARGATNINEALLSALDMFSLVMLTDGLPTMGETNTKTIRQNVLENNNAKVTLYCLGFGFDLDFPFLKAMSLENFGIAFRIYENKDASAQITDFYDTISTPLLRGLTFSYSDGAYEVYPTYVEQLFEGAEIVVVGKYNGTSRMITASVSAMSWEGKKTFKETFKLF